MALVTLDLRELKCPLPVLRTRKALARLDAGDRLEVVCTDPLAVIDIPNLVNQTGDRVEIVRHDANSMVFLIEKLQCG